MPEMSDPRFSEIDLLSSDSSRVPEPLDVLILADGNDELRGSELVKRYLSLGSTIDLMIIFRFNERDHGVREDAGEKTLQELAQALAHQFISIEVPIMDPTSATGPMDAWTEYLCAGKKVGIDITLFTKPYFFWLIKYLHRTGLARVSVFYTEPESYRYSQGSPETYHSTAGPLTVSEIQGFPGGARVGESTHLTIFLGFDGELSAAVNEDVAPEELVVVNGFPSYVPKFKDISLVNNSDTVDAATERRSSAADNPFDTYNELELIRKSAGEKPMTIAPLGTKPMALGACLFAISHEDVRIVLPLPNEYLTKTTRKSWRTWRYGVTFSDLSPIRR